MFAGYQPALLAPLRNGGSWSAPGVLVVTGSLSDWMFGGSGADRKTPNRKYFVMVRAYKLYFTGATTASALASIQLPRAGQVVAVQWAVSVLHGAGVDGRVLYELSTSSVTTATTNDAPGNDLGHIAIGTTGIASSVSAQNTTQPCGVTLAAGDKLYIHCLAAGTAATSAVGAVIVYIVH